MSRTRRKIFAIGIGFVLLAGLAIGGNAVARANGFGRGLTFDVLNVANDLGWRWLPDQHITSPEGYPLDINNYGMRAPRDISVKKPEGIFRVLCVGDSFTHGLTIPHEKTFSFLVEKALGELLGNRSIEIWNTGVNGYNSCQELAWMRDFGHALDPDMIIVGFVMNDAFPMAIKHPKRFPGRTWMLRYPLYQWLRFNYLFKWRLAGDDLETDRLKKLIRQHKGQTVKKPSESKVSQQFWDDTLACLGDLADTATARDIPVVLLIFPTLYQMNNSRPLPEPQVLLNAMAAQHNYRVVDLLERYAAAGLPALIESDKSHPSVLGNQIAAKELLASLLSSGWLPANSPHPEDGENDG